MGERVKTLCQINCHDMFSLLLRSNHYAVLFKDCEMETTNSFMFFQFSISIKILTYITIMREK